MNPSALGALAPAQDLIEEALHHASGEGCVVIVEDTHEAELRFANNTTTTNGQRLVRTVTVISLWEVAGGVAAGVARRGGEVDLDDLVRAAESDAKTSPAAEDAIALVTSTATSDFAAAPGTTDLSSLSSVVGGLGAAFHRARDAEHVLAGFAEHAVRTTYLGTSTGLRARHCQPTGAFHLVARSADQQRSAWVGTGSSDFASVSLAELEATVVQRLEWARRQIPMEPGRYEVILPESAVADLMVALAQASEGQDAEDGRSVFSAPGGRTRVGDVLSALPFELRSDPVEPGIECSPVLFAEASSSDVSVFDNGFELQATPWIRGGRLEQLRYHRAGAARSGTRAAPPIDNLILELPGALDSVEDLVARTDRGLLLTCLWYIRPVDPATLLLTGLTRDGVYLVEGGKVIGAVNNFRFNESPVDLLSRATEAGRSTRTLGREFGEWVNRTKMPPLRIPDFNMSSVSQAS